MSAIADLIDLVISTQTQTASVASFGVPVVVCDDAGFGELYRTYSDPDDITADTAFTSTAGIRLANLVLQQEPSCGSVIVASAADASVAGEYDTTLSDLVGAGVDFFGIIAEDNGATIVAECTAWAETNKRMFIAAPVVSVVADFAAPAAAMVSASAKYSFGILTKDNNAGDLAAAIFGRCFAANPGAINWTHRTLSGVVADVWTDTERTAMKSQGSGWYETVAGLAMVRGGTATYEGWVSYGGHYPDVVRGTAWLEAETKAAIVTLLSRVDKVPFTDEGGAMAYNTIKPVLSLAESNAYKLLAPGTVLYVPPVGDVASGDKAARFWTGITFTGVYQGAVNKFRIRGTLTA